MDPLTPQSPRELSPAPAPAPVPPRRRGSVQRWWTVFGVVVVAACLAFVGSVGYEIFQFVSADSCGTTGEKMAPGLSKLPELQLHPSTATPKGVPTWYCDPDQDESDWFVSQRFESTEAPRATLAYYRQALTAAGWTALKDIGEGNPQDKLLFEGPDGIVCVTRKIQGARAYLRVTYPTPDERSITTYALNASTSSTPGGACGFF